MVENLLDMVKREIINDSSNGMFSPNDFIKFENNHVYVILYDIFLSNKQDIEDSNCRYIIQFTEEQFENIAENFFNYGYISYLNRVPVKEETKEEVESSNLTNYSSDYQAMLIANINCSKDFSFNIKLEKIN